MNNKRTIWLILVSLILVGGKIIWYFYSNWGLITLNADKQPLNKIVAQIQRQGHVNLRTNLDPATPVTLHLLKVPVADALETLSVVTESRWRLHYFLAPDAATLRSGINSIVSGQKSGDWKLLYYPFPQLFVPENGIIPDPRLDAWPAKAPVVATLQAQLERAAKRVHAGFSVPEKWNPSLASTPKPGVVAKILPQLAGAAHGKYEAVFLLLKSDRRQGRGEGSEGGGRDFDWMAERAEAEINRLPAEEQVAAKAEWEQRQAVFKQFSGLSPEERRAKMQDLANDPQMQEQMDKRQAQRDARSTPEQKAQRAQNYVNRKQALLHPQ